MPAAAMTLPVISTSNGANDWARMTADDLDTLSIAYFLAQALRGMGRYAEARDLDQATLARYRRVPGDDHPQHPEHRQQPRRRPACAGRRMITLEAAGMQAR